MIVQILILAVCLLVAPVLAGGLVSGGTDRKNEGLCFLWAGGQLLLWAGFQVLCVPVVLLNLEDGFRVVVILYGAFSGVLALAGGILLLKRYWEGKRSLRAVPNREKRSRLYYVMWALFWALLLFQLVQAVCMTYADGDDAFYVAVSTITQESKSMYVKLPYTGGSTGLDTRHGLAPFPIWIAFLSQLSGMRTVSVAHVAVPLALIPMTYAVYYLLGVRLCGKKGEKLPIFMFFSSLLVLFGDYSFYTAENFLIARTRQGKAALGNLIIPALIFLLLVLLEKLQENQKCGRRFWLMLVSAVIAGCLCSTLGALLACMLVGVTGACAAVCYRRWKILLPMAAACLPAVCFAVLYLLLE